MPIQETAIKARFAGLNTSALTEADVLVLCWGGLRVTFRASRGQTLDTVVSLIVPEDGISYRVPASSYFFGSMTESSAAYARAVQFVEDNNLEQD